MLTQNEILNEVFTLPVSEQREIAEKIQDHIEQSNGTESKELSIEERKKIVENLYGIAAVEGKTPPTDEEVEEDYINYLSEKYK